MLRLCTKMFFFADMEQQCMEQQMQRYGNHCYLVVSFPAVPWSTAHQICSTLKVNDIMKNCRIFYLFNTTMRQYIITYD